MRGYFKEDQSRGDFSTSFGDMVFGLLFFFFVLTLAMVFNRSDVGSFHKEIDQLNAKLQQGDRQIQVWQKRSEEMSRALETIKRETDSLKKEQQADKKKLHESREAYKLLQKQHQSILASLDTTTDQYSKLLTRYDRLLADYKRLSKGQVESLRKGLAKAQKEQADIRIKLTAYQNILKKMKLVLKSKGLTTILAEVEKMEKGTRQASQGEETPSNVYKVFAKLYPDGYLDVRLLKGESEMSAYFAVPDTEALEIAKRVNQSFSSESETYSEEERLKTQPKIFLMAHPEIQYGELQKFLAKARKLIPVSIVPWKNE
ncbi:MAG: hypothetical protein RBS57_03200 [Desulforhabdus sp.]|jgi:hypothetical protein|nr:hypothetical protein [Desulforhabdus sp.]